jgi:hypothetical protein
VSLQCIIVLFPRSNLFALLCLTMFSYSCRLAFGSMCRAGTVRFLPDHQPSPKAFGLRSSRGSGSVSGLQRVLSSSKCVRYNPILRHII